MPTSKTKTILITGCSAHGIGAALALTLARQGHFIFATARNTTKISESLSALENVQVLPLDVTDSATIADAVRAVREHGRGLDILVNNAGTGYTMPLLEADLDRAKAVYEANVWGLLRLVQACSDLLVAAEGRIVNMSSVGAVVNTPRIGSFFFPFRRDQHKRINYTYKQGSIPPPKPQSPSCPRRFVSNSRPWALACSVSWRVLLPPTSMQMSRKSSCCRLPGMQLLDKPFRIGRLDRLVPKAVRRMSSLT